MSPTGRSRSARRGFTLIELLVVIAIILLLAIATLPVVVPTLTQGQINEGARQFHAELTHARDSAIRANAPQGIRLIPDAFDPTNPNQSTVARRMIAIEQGPDYHDGKIIAHALPFAQFGADDLRYDFAPFNGIPYSYGLLTPTGQVLRTWILVREAKVVSGLPTSPTSWYWNIRQGEKLRVEGVGGSFTIAGPISAIGAIGPAANPERFVNYPLPTVWVPGDDTSFEFLIVLNGQDDDRDGFTDEAFDGLDNDGDGVVDPGFNGLDDNGNGQVDEPAELLFNNLGEYEVESPVFTAPFPTAPYQTTSYVIKRRPVVTPSAREVTLPGGILVDLTTWNSPFLPPVNGMYRLVPERSRVPVDPFSGHVDIMIAPNGQAIQMSSNGNPAPPTEYAFYHFWLTDLEGVNEPFDVPTMVANETHVFRLPMPSGTQIDPLLIADPPAYLPHWPTLKGNRRLITLNTKTGQIATTSLETFAANDPNRPFQAAQAGAKEEP
jgi:prepilin-type N-terminal cleavage/methylation domain-containing protein